MLYFLILLCSLSTSFGVISENSSSPQTTFPTKLSPFVNNFLKLVQSSPELQSIYALAAIEDRNYDAFYNFALQAAIQYNITDPQSLAKSVTDAITSVADKLTYYNKAVVDSGAVGRLLEDNNLLTIDNSAKLATLLANALLDQNQHIQPGPVAHVKVIVYGDLEFLKMMNIVSTKTVEGYVRYLTEGFTNLRKFV